MGDETRQALSPDLIGAIQSDLCAERARGFEKSGTAEKRAVRARENSALPPIAAECSSLRNWTSMKPKSSRYGDVDMVETLAEVRETDGGARMRLLLC